MLRIALLNLMPNKEETEADFAHICAKSAEPVHFVLTKMDSHVTRHASAEHMALYTGSAAVCQSHDNGQQPLDGVIITGAPFDWVDFTDVDYWPELCRLMDWLRAHRIPTLYVCWGAQAALHYFHHISRFEEYPHKLSGIFPQRILFPEHPLFRGIEEPLCIPHSRHTSMTNSEIDACTDVKVLVRAEETGISIVECMEGLEFYLIGHQEYNLHTLDNEYRRDVGRGLPVRPPRHYYEDDDPARPIVDTWQANGQRLFANWLEYYCRDKGLEVSD